MSAPTNTGGPAFPAICHSVNGVPLHPGMTVRDYFGAHAPEMPSWFQCEPSRPRPLIPSRAELTDEQRRELEEYELADGNASPEVMDFADRRRAATDAIAAWEQEQKAHNFIAWRWHYADMMVRAREAS